MVTCSGVKKKSTHYDDDDVFLKKYDMKLLSDEEDEWESISGKSPIYLPEDTSMPYSGFETEPTRLRAECHSHHTGWDGAMDWWPTCEEIEPSIAEDPLYRGDRCMLNISRFKHPPVGAEVRRGSTSSGVIVDT
ncbi:hypothetical protein TNCV_1900981 [Trichonephila clavipes]|nr:hypothetical protein TNCV_1900981 [Trichonephila clavipes]